MIRPICATFSHFAVLKYRMRTPVFTIIFMAGCHRLRRGRLAERDHRQRPGQDVRSGGAARHGRGLPQRRLRAVQGVHWALTTERLHEEERNRHSLTPLSPSPLYPLYPQYTLSIPQPHPTPPPPPATTLLFHSPPQAVNICRRCEALRFSPCIMLL